MRSQRKCFSCYSCGREVECFPGEPPCEALKNWLIVSYWKGLGEVSHYNFCSFSCLKSWIDVRVPKIPKVFLESFKENET